MAMVKPYLPVASCTIARWLKKVLEETGIDVNIFSAHLVRGASSSTAALAGVTNKDILEAADWRRCFCYTCKPPHMVMQSFQLLVSS